MEISTNIDDVFITSERNNNMKVYQIKSITYCMGECEEYLREGLIFASKQAANDYMERHSWVKGTPIEIEVIE
jgi:hypothetical protein